jgi:hypothetical protein
LWGPRTEGAMAPALPVRYKQDADDTQARIPVRLVEPAADKG